ncbi:MAG: hypothetical protein AAGH57_11155 [Pseudomonadota bacterium]
MMKAASKLTLASAAFGLALAPIAAQAKTRASSSAISYSAPAASAPTASAQSAPGQGREASGEKLATGADFLAALLVALWASGIIVIVADDDDTGDRQSPGT